MKDLPFLEEKALRIRSFHGRQERHIHIFVELEAAIKSKYYKLLQKVVLLVCRKLERKDSCSPFRRIKFDKQLQSVSSVRGFFYQSLCLLSLSCVEIIFFSICFTIYSRRFQRFNVSHFPMTVRKRESAMKSTLAELH